MKGNSDIGSSYAKKDGLYKQMYKMGEFDRDVKKLKLATKRG